MIISKDLWLVFDNKTASVLLYKTIWIWSSYSLVVVFYRGHHRLAEIRHNCKHLGT
jgi:hypothetical protein